MTLGLWRRLVHKWKEWRARRSGNTLTLRWWKEREHLGQRVEYHGPVIKFPIKRG